ncbi:MAG TPA: Ti-type conjugative transfer relaxase TraA, partial [Acidimicrobiia bacterium]
DGRQYQAGDRVLCQKNNPRIGVLNGDLGTVAAIDPEAGALTVRLDRHAEPVQLPGWYLNEGHADHGYAVTCHKAQGATVDQAFVVASGSITREWAYVAMSRGRTANTMYLADPPRDEDCDHVTHDRSADADRLIAALARLDAQVAAIDERSRPQPGLDAVSNARLALARSRAARNRREQVRSI